MRILSYNPGHDGAIVYLNNGQLVMSIEAEKDSNYRYSPVSSADVFAALSEFDEIPEIICTGGWWPRGGEAVGQRPFANYQELEVPQTAWSVGKLFGRDVKYFTSSHERSHLLCAFGLSELPRGTPCYALIWEGAIGAFYEIDERLNIKLLGNVMNEPGNRYTSIYGLADPTFPKNAPFSRFSDAGKLMALASYSTRAVATAAEEKLIRFLLDVDHVQLDLYTELKLSPHYNVGVDDNEFRNFAGIFSDRIFQKFFEFAQRHCKKRLPLIIAGGCGLNCDWNSKWRACGLFEGVFVPPVANDSGSAIGTAIDAQFQLTGNPKISWSVYAGLSFRNDLPTNLREFDVLPSSPEVVANLLEQDFILGWAQGRYEIGPRALGNRSIIAAPFKAHTTERLNKIKKREQFRPVAPICLIEDSQSLFGCAEASPFMLYTYPVKSDALAAVTHVNGTARIQTVSRDSNFELYRILRAFKERTGFGVLCNTSLNFNGRGFINRLSDLCNYAIDNSLDGFVVDDRIYLVKKSEAYQRYRQCLL